MSAEVWTMSELWIFCKRFPVVSRYKILSLQGYVMPRFCRSYHTDHGILFFHHHQNIYYFSSDGLVEETIEFEEKILFEYILQVIETSVTGVMSSVGRILSLGSSQLIVSVSTSQLST